MKYVIIGGVAAGASFATRLRRLDENAEIKIFEKTNFVSYANCGLPYYISGTIKEKESLTLQSPASLKERFNIDVFVNSEVKNVFPSEHKIKVLNLKTNEDFEENYDKLIIATGAEAIKIAPLSNKIFELKTVEDTLKIKSYITKNHVKSTIIIGGGFIGLEILENLKKLNLNLTLLEGSSHCLANLDDEMASLIHQEIISKNISLNLNTMVQKVEENDKEVIVHTNKGIFKADILIQSIGVKASSTLLKDISQLGIKDSIKVDSNFETDFNDIYAIGDVISLPSFFDGKEIYIPLAGNANKEGRELASNLLLNEKIDIKPIGTSILKVFSLNGASTGLNETQIKLKNIPYDKIYLSPFNHASYYPDPKMMIIKVLFNKKTYEILGAQIVGEEGVDKRIDLLSMAIKYKIKGYDLKKAELSYAPPFGSAKDPINMIGYMIENIKNGLVKQFFSEDIENIKNDLTKMLVDVRTREEFADYHIENSINIPIDELRNNLDKLNKDKEICLICLSAVRSYIGCRILSQKGYNCSHLAGGMRVYQLFKMTKN